jgi:hypothetical protein
MEKSVANVGRRLTVRLDGKGDSRTIQGGVNAASIGDLVEIQDNGPYSESVTIGAEKNRLTLRGRKGVWPLIISMEPNSVVGPLIGVRGPNTTLQRMILVNLGAVGRTPNCLDCTAGGMKVEGVLVAGSTGGICCEVGDSEFDTCLLLIGGLLGRARLRNSLLASGFRLTVPCELRTCTVRHANLESGTSTLSDCIVGDLSVRERTLGHRMDHCVVFGSASSDIQRGQGCLDANPMFRDAANLDYRLRPGSPCLGRASDGGDLGCRYTPEMIELCKVALELCRKGILKF